MSQFASEYQKLTFFVFFQRIQDHLKISKTNQHKDQEAVQRRLHLPDCHLTPMTLQACS